MANKALGGVLPASRILATALESASPSPYKALKPPASASETDSWSKGHLANGCQGEEFWPTALVAEKLQ